MTDGWRHAAKGHRLNSNPGLLQREQMSTCCVFIPATTFPLKICICKADCLFCSVCFDTSTWSYRRMNMKDGPLIIVVVAFSYVSRLICLFADRQTTVETLNT